VLQDEVARALVVRGVGVKHSQNLRCRRAGAVLMDSGTDWMDSVTCVDADEQCNTSHIAVVLWLQSCVYASPYHVRSSKVFQFIQG
jgi:hypothetical protein